MYEERHILQECQALGQKNHRRCRNQQLIKNGGKNTKLTLHKMANALETEVYARNTVTLLLFMLGSCVEIITD